MEKYILIDNKKFFYDELELYHGRKRINREIAFENLKIFNNHVKDTNIKYGLIFGTLLGAIRENNFIEHDEDTDIYILSENKSEFIKLLPILKEKGMQLARINDTMLSLIRNNEYIDVYFFKKKILFPFTTIRILRTDFKLKASYLENSIMFNFLDINIPIPSNPQRVLKKLYGKNWRIPIVNKFAEPNTLKFFIFKCIPVLKNIRLNKNIERKIKKIFY